MKEFLTVYDYGMGGAWTLILAERPEDIEARYPELTHIEEPPEVMTVDEFERIHREPPTS